MPLFWVCKTPKPCEALFSGQDSPLVILGAYFAKSKLFFYSADLAGA